MSYREPKRGESTDNAIRHFIFGGLLLIDALGDVIFNLIITPYEKAKKAKKENLLLEKRKERLAAKTNDQLRALLAGIQVTSGLNKTELIDSVFSNTKSLEKLIIEEKKEKLMYKTNHELRSILKNKEKASRLNKSQLVDLILSQDKLNSYTQ